MSLTGGAILLAEFGAQGRNFLDADRGEIITPGTEYVSQGRSKVFVGQIAEAGHDAVVVDTINGYRTGQAE